MRRTSVLLAIGFIFVLPFALVWAGVVPVEFRRWLYVVAGIVVLATARRRWSWKDLGFRWDNALEAALPYAAFALFGTVGIVAVALVSGRTVREAWWLAPHFRYGLLIPVSVAQEFFYRGMLMPMLGRLTTSRPIIVIANAALFTFLHIIFPDPAVVLPVSFLGGIAFAALWLRYPNVWLASAAHVVLNAVFTLFCFGGFDGSCQ